MFITNLKKVVKFESYIALITLFVSMWGPVTWAVVGVIYGTVHIFAFVIWALNKMESW